MLLKIKAGQEPEIADRYLGQFAELGIDPNRITVCGWKSPIEHFETYSQVDIALDTFPYNGTTTTCEALWMGVPTVSLVGQCHASRVGLSILSRVGLEFFAASTPQEYVAKTLALASNRSALAHMRRSMRARIASSGLCHAKAFTGHLEAAYRTMWHRWCQSRSTNTGGDLWARARRQATEMRSASHTPSVDLPFDRAEK
jgi:predicted O-linked N-acetylglucosamine transferase (SPINDLY family)